MAIKTPVTSPEHSYFAYQRSIILLNPYSRPHKRTFRSSIMIAVIFEANAIPAQQERYLQLAAELKPELEQIAGFISIERF